MASLSPITGSHTIEQNNMTHVHTAPLHLICTETRVFNMITKNAREISLLRQWTH